MMLVWIQLDGLCFLVAYQLNSLFIFMIFLFDVQLINKYDDDDDVCCVFLLYAITLGIILLSDVLCFGAY